MRNIHSTYVPIPEDRESYNVIQIFSLVSHQDYYYPCEMYALGREYGLHFSMEQYLGQKIIMELL